MSELIDRQAAIDAIRASTSKYTGFMEMEMYMADDAVEAIKVVPTASTWRRVEDELPSEFQDVWAACKMNGRENWTIETMYDPYLSCPWGHIPVLESGKAIVYAWMDRSAPEPPKEE